MATAISRIQSEITNHVATLVSMDFFTVPTFTGRVLFVLVLLSHRRQRIIHIAIASGANHGCMKTWRLDASSE
jgi:hypothetical protein